MASFDDDLIDKMVKSKELSDKTLEVIMKNTGLTMDEAKILWQKSMSFTDVLQTRYGSEYYAMKMDEMCKVTKLYQQRMIESLIKQRGKKQKEYADVDKVVDEWLGKEAFCPRCIEDHDDEHGERVSGSKVVSSCDDCGVCENCEHLMECKGLKEYQMLTEKNRLLKEKDRLLMEENQLLMEENQLLMEEEKKKVVMGKKIIEKYEQFIEDHQEEMEKNQKEIEAMEENPLLGEYQLKMLAAKRKFAENYEEIIEHHQKTSKAFDEWLAERSKRDDGKKEEEKKEEEKKEEEKKEEEKNTFDSQIEACSNVWDDGTIEIDVYELLKMAKK